MQLSCIIFHCTMMGTSSCPLLLCNKFELWAIANAAGAYVIVINAEKVAIGGKKSQQKKYYRHSGQPGGLKTETFEHLQKVRQAQP